MAETGPPLEEGRKARDRSFCLVLVGLALLLPPLAGIVLIDNPVFGIPLPVVYVFAVWGALIIGAASLAKPLRDLDAPRSSAERPGAVDS